MAKSRGYADLISVDTGPVKGSVRLAFFEVWNDEKVHKASVFIPEDVAARLAAALAERCGLAPATPARRAWWKVW